MYEGKRKEIGFTYNDIHGGDKEIYLCEWANGEGYDLSIGDKPIISLTHTEADAIQAILSMFYLHIKKDE